MSALDRQQLHARLDAMLDEIDAGTSTLTSLAEHLSALSNGAFAASVRNSALQAMRAAGFDPDMVDADHEQLKRKYHQAAMMMLLLEARAILPGNFNAGAMVFDLHNMLTDDAAPQILTGAGTEESLDAHLKKLIRERFATGVIYRAAREGVSRDVILKRLGVAMGKSTWNDWRGKGPEAQKRNKSAEIAGKANLGWPTPTSDEGLKALFQKGLGKTLPRK